MKSINLLKKLEEEQTNKTKAKNELSKDEQYLKQVYNFIDNFVMKKLHKLVVDNIISTKDEIRNQATNIAIELNTINETNTKEFHLISKEEIGFIESKEKKVKTSVGNRISEYLIRNYSYEKIVDNYIERYIVPMLKRLSNEDKIVFDLTSTDKEIKLITDNSLMLVKKFIYDDTYETITLPLKKLCYSEEELFDYEFLFNDNQERKDKYNSTIEEVFEYHYDKQFLKNMKVIDFTKYKEEISK